MNEAEEFYKDAPESIKPTIVMENANEDISIYEGDFIVKQDGREISVNGVIKFCWFPNSRTVFSGKVTSENYININQIKDVTIVVDGLDFAVGQVNNRFINQSQNIYTLRGSCHSATSGDKSLSVNEINFSIPNLRGLYGTLVKTVDHESISGEDGRIYFEDEKFIITFDKIDGFNNHEEELASKGGYLIMYGGKVAKKRGAISLEEFKQVHFAVSNFLYFINGRRTAPLFMQGIHDGTVLWTDYTAHNVDQYKKVSSWTQFQWFSDLSSIWKNFLILWKDESNKDFLITVIHWYVEANSNAAFIEGSIIIAQTALELLYNWLIIEQKKLIIGNDAEGLSASNKIRLVISELNIDPSIPVRYSELLEFSQQSNADIMDAPEVLTKVRNALIHGQEKKRKELIKMEPQAKYQALQTALWYIELAILKIIKYDGKYWNRAEQKNELVPWKKLED
jgi:hypothetical protein